MKHSLLKKVLIALAGCIILMLLIYWPLGVFIEAHEKANVNYGIINVKLLAEEILRYRKEHHVFPQAFTIEELLLEIQFDPRQLKPSIEPNLHSCIYLKGLENYNGDIILIWRSKVKRKFFSRNKYYYELCLYDDGHLEGTARFIESF